MTTVPLTFPAITGSHFIVTFTAIRPEYAANYYSAGPLALPLGIAEIGFPGGVVSSPTPPELPGNCVSNLLTIDGQPIDVSIVGSDASARRRRGPGGAVDGALRVAYLAAIAPLRHLVVYPLMMRDIGRGWRQSVVGARRWDRGGAPGGPSVVGPQH